ncbi:hypothetical protein [Williamsoniiplasma lucivorax]|uniref:Lipoprotein n=1 Tax=Williamsoniiplasma lucivorax TaxID=209274 RepID=A0A2S5RF36_9MOLU|nr:hypothetical protein [Williamsoniiplasma lucivorax]PPE05921.1 hypothetical protein ELUCI_v1c02110 [Williamsoniiplasma lucivorax]
MEKILFWLSSLIVGITACTSCVEVCLCPNQKTQKDISIGIEITNLKIGTSKKVVLKMIKQKLRTQTRVNKLKLNHDYQIVGLVEKRVTGKIIVKAMTNSPHIIGELIIQPIQ